MITVNNNYGGTVVINDTPQGWRKGWAKKIRAFGLYFYVSNCRMKKRPKRDVLFTGYREHIHVENKKKLYERQGGDMFGVRTAHRIQGYGTSPCFALCPIP